MKKYLIVFMTACLLCFSSICMAQSYDFSDQQLPENWYGQKEHFAISPMEQLQLQAPAGSASSYLAWDAPATADCIWEFYIHYAFAASTSNYATFHVLSQQQDPATAGIKGYYLKIGGETGSTDKVELYYQDGTVKIKILESSIGLAGASSVALRLRLQRHGDGRWVLSADPLGAFAFKKEASGMHQSKELFLYSAIRCIYSSTRRSSFYFDDIRITEPFTLQSYSFENTSALTLRFTKELDPKSAYHLSIIPSSAFTSSIHGTLMELQFNETIATAVYSLNLQGLKTMSGDIMADSVFMIEKKPFYYTGQLRITELMADPSPPASLPESEFIELLNTGKTAVDLSLCTIQDPSVRCKLPSYVLQPDSCLILCPKNMCATFKRSNCIELLCFPNLNNDGDSIRLMINDTLPADAFYYSLLLLPNDFRKNGGYSIMRSTMPSDCIMDHTLTFSNAYAGGTPGVTEFIPINTSVIFHTEALCDTSFVIHSNIAGIPEYRSEQWMPMQKNNGTIGSFDWSIYLDKSLEQGSAKTGMVHSLKTCTGETRTIDQPFTIINPALPKKGSLYLNEILYNPFIGGVDFIELFNASDLYVNMKSLHVYHVSNGKQQHLSLNDQSVISPNDYIVLTPDTSILFSQYLNAVHTNCKPVHSFLSLPDEGGELILMSFADTLDHISYGDFLQNPLNREDEGISVEKINAYTSDFYSFNWTSSATKASPGQINSQNYVNESHSSKPLYCEPCHVTTNLNGMNDWVLLHLNTNTSLSRGSLSIFSLSGDKVVDLFSNQLLAPENTFQWNGQSAGSTVLPDGIYIAVAQWWLPDGHKYEFRIPISTSAH